MNKEKTKKYMVVGICSVALLGSGLAYSTLKESDNPHKIEVKDKRQESKKKTKEIKDQFANQTGEKLKKGKKLKKSKKVAQSVDPLDQMVEVKSSDVKVRSNHRPLITQLADAVADQSEKTDKRQPTLLAMDTSKKEEKPFLQDKLMKEDKGVLKELDKKIGEEPSTDKVVVPIEPINPDKPIIPIDPVTPIDPEKPVIPIDPDPEKPDISQLTATARMNLEGSVKEATQLNQRMEKIQEKIKRISTVKETTDHHQEAAKDHWHEVSALVREYNELSERMTQLMTEKHEVALINQDLYRETYQKLQVTVEKMKETQQKATKEVTEAHQAVKEAKSVDQISADFKEKIQPKVTQAKEQVKNRLDQTNENSEVADNLKEEVSNAVETVQDVTKTEEKVEQGLQTVNDSEQAENREAAQETLHSMEIRNGYYEEKVEGLVEAFNQLPENPEVPEVTPETPVTPDVSQENQVLTNESKTTETPSEASSGVNSDESMATVGATTTVNP